MVVEASYYEKICNYDIYFLVLQSLFEMMNKTFVIIKVAKTMSGVLGELTL